VSLIAPQNKIYTGIGSRSTPEDVLHLMRKIAIVFDHLGWTLYSGHAKGADEWFESGSRRKKIFLPWKNFEGSDSPFIHDFDSDRGKMAEKTVDIYHPAPYRLSATVRSLMARNCYQISGWNHTPEEMTDLVIAWTRDGKDAGGTGQAIRIAWSCDIPVVNLYNQPERENYEQWVAQYSNVVQF
jgi:hypothetical protein